MSFLPAQRTGSVSRSLKEPLHLSWCAHQGLTVQWALRLRQLSSILSSFQGAPVPLLEPYLLLPKGSPAAWEEASLLELNGRLALFICWSEGH